MKKNGWVQKKSHGMFARWQSRFILHQAGTLTLKHDPTESRCRLFDVISASEGPTETLITVNCKDGRMLLLKAASPGERDDWLKAFQEPEPAPPQQPLSVPQPPVNGTPSPTSVEISARDVAVASAAPTDHAEDQKNSFRANHPPPTPDRSSESQGPVLR